MTIERYCVTPTASLLECLKKIDKAASGIALAIDKDYKLIGTISDGDIRRAIIGGSPLNSSIEQHINKNCFTVTASVNRTDVLDIMQARKFEQVPITDKNRKVVGLHLLHDLIGQYSRPNWAIIMAGGKGTRLRPITNQVPKPMVQVAGRPILERIILHFISYGITNIYLAVNYLSHIIKDYFEDGERHGCTIRYLREDEPLGSGGALSLLEETPKEPFFLMNGDLIVNINFAEMLDFHIANDFYATMGVYGYTHEIPFGCAKIKDGKILQLEEKPIIRKTINAGIYVLAPEALKTIPQNTFFPITHLFDQALESDRPCGAFEIENEWLDIGRPQQLKQARGEA